MCSRVDLPEPERPMIAVSSPAWMSRSTPRSASTGVAVALIGLGDAAQADERRRRARPRAWRRRDPRQALRGRRRAAASSAAPGGGVRHPPPATSRRSGVHAHAVAQSLDGPTTTSAPSSQTLGDGDRGDAGQAGAHRRLAQAPAVDAIHERIAALRLHRLGRAPAGCRAPRRRRSRRRPSCPAPARRSADRDAPAPPTPSGSPSRRRSVPPR